MNQQLKSQNIKHEFLYKWFETYHVAIGWMKYDFCKDLLFSDSYLLKILSISIPNEFEPFDEEEEIPNLQALSYQQQHKKIETAIEMKLFTALKVFFKTRELDLTEVLKQIRIKKQANKAYDYQSWEKAYWQLAYIVFTAFYIENVQNEYLENYFQLQLRQDLQQMKLVLDIISSVLRRTQSPDLIIAPSLNQVSASSQNILTPANQSQQSILILENQNNEDSETMVISTQDNNNSSSLMMNATSNLHEQIRTQTQINNQHYIVQVSDIDYIKRITESSEGSQGTEEDDEDDLLKEDVEGWDVFDDYHKFKHREQKIKEKRKLIAKLQKQEREKQKNEEIEMEQSRNFEKEFHELEGKLKTLEETLKKKNERENSLLNEINIYESKVQMKQMEVEAMQQKMILFETFKHKFEVKKKEADRLLTRVEELSQMKGNLEEQINKSKDKTYKLNKKIEDLNDKVKSLQTGNAHQNDLRDFEHIDHALANPVTHGNRVIVPKINLEQIDEESKAHPSLDGSLSAELYQRQNPYSKGNGMNLCLQTKPSLDDEEFFDTSNSYRSQYRFETTEDELVNQDDYRNGFCNDLDPENMDSYLLRQEYLREQTEKTQFRNLYLEQQERCYHYQQMMQEYERLYSEFLTKSIKAEKEKMELIIKLRRVNKVSNCITTTMSSLNPTNIRKNIQRSTKRQQLIYNITALFIGVTIVIGILSIL
ncbi:UNKNOWN [Stylonychia lemnae]|uniref:Uncharacterized protein n=1 Tax=Stylonychia lemnae TaxID=5949 RepID=A0A078AK59_STYLE|nr:UNKNOWN [Stylonychia lemnae]|eukprot:CDW81842.1 UNKNOWN [Stylonychia lemnae]